MQNQFRLDDLLARDVVPQWFEGVAVVQLICRQLRAQGRERSGFPRPEDILIGAGGFVTLTGGLDDKPVEAAAHVLALMMGNDVPVRLRLSITQASATDGGYASLTEFSEALAYFERPNPEAIVETFRQRAIAASPRETVPAVRVDARPAVEKPSAPTPAAVPSRVGRLAVIAATLLALASASTWLIAHRDTVWTPMLALAKMTESPTPDDHSSAKDVNEKTPAKATRQRENTATAHTLQSLEPKTRSAGSVLEPAPEPQVSATTLSYAYPDVLPAAPISNEPATTPVTIVTPDEIAAADPEAMDSDRIYSRADSQVRMPVSVYPKLPSDGPGTPVTGRTILELTIAADGLVERVKMLTAPRNIHEFMLVSAAKAWRFEPARLGDRPVRFRQMMTLPSQR